LAKPFTEEEVALLLQNPCIAHISSNKIWYTYEFKAEFYERYKKGEMAAAILKSVGIEPEILGKNRVIGLINTLRNELERNGTFKPLRHRGYPEFTDTISDVCITEPMPPNTPIEKVVHKVAYLEQEVEFIKKAIILEREAMRKGSSETALQPSSN